MLRISDSLEYPGLMGEVLGHPGGHGDVWGPQQRVHLVLYVPGLEEDVLAQREVQALDQLLRPIVHWWDFISNPDNSCLKIRFVRKNKSQVIKRT